MSVSIHIHTQEGPPDPRWLFTPDRPPPHPEATLPRWPLVNWLQAGIMQSKGLHALMATSCLVFKGHLARFQDGFKPAGPFWAPPPFLPGSRFAQSKVGPLGSKPLSQSLWRFPFTASPEAPTGSVWIVLA